MKYGLIEKKIKKYLTGGVKIWNYIDGSRKKYILTS